MRKIVLTLSLGALCAFSQAGFAADAMPLDINATSLEKTSPFEVPQPDAFEMKGGKIRETPFGTPAIIPHSIAGFEMQPNMNSCLMCHGDQSKIDKPKVAKQPTAMPSTHWTKKDGKLVMHGSRHLCTLCHVQQADAQPLVETVR